MYELSHYEKSIFSHIYTQTTSDKCTFRHLHPVRTQITLCISSLITVFTSCSLEWQGSEVTSDWKQRLIRLTLCWVHLSSYIVSCCSLNSEGPDQRTFTVWIGPSLYPKMSCVRKETILIPYTNIESKNHLNIQNIMHSTLKGLLYNLGTTKALISLCICTGWSGLLLSTYRMNGYCSICWWTENVQIRLYWYACSSVYLLVAYGMRAFLHCCTSYMIRALVFLTN